MMKRAGLGAGDERGLISWAVDPLIGSSCDLVAPETPCLSEWFGGLLDMVAARSIQCLS